MALNIKKKAEDKSKPMVIVSGLNTYIIERVGVYLWK